MDNRIQYKDMTEDMKQQIQKIFALNKLPTFSDIDCYVYKENDKYIWQHVEMQRSFVLNDDIKLGKKEKTRIANHEAFRQSSILFDTLSKRMNVLQETVFNGSDFSIQQSNKGYISIKINYPTCYLLVNKIPFNIKSEKIETFIKENAVWCYGKGFSKTVEAVRSALNANRRNEFIKKVEDYHNVSDFVRDILPKKINNQSCLEIHRTMGIQSEYPILWEDNKPFCKIEEGFYYNLSEQKFCHDEKTLFAPLDDVVKLYNTLIPIFQDLEMKFDKLKDIDKTVYLTHILNIKQETISLKLTCKFPAYKATAKKTISYQLSAPVYKRKNAEAIKHFRETAEAALKEKKAKEKQRNAELLNKQKELWKSFKNSKYYGSCLVYDILNLIDLNSNFIMEKNVIASLRGTAISDSSMLQVSNHGKYNMVNVQTMHKMISDMIAQGFVKTKTIDGPYCRYDILKPVSNFFEMLKKEKSNYKFNKSKQPSKYLTWDWEYVLTHTENLNTKEVSWWKKQLLMLDDMEIVALYFNEISAFFNQAPKEIRMYIRTKAEICDSKTYKKIAKTIKLR